MAQQRDPVCGVMVETTTAIGPVTYRERHYYFCSDEHRRQFETTPERFLRDSPAPPSASGDPEAEARPTADEGRETGVEAGEPEPEVLEPERPYTRTDGMTAPRFGSAGSGGLEFEPGPRRHDDPEAPR